MNSAAVLIPALNCTQRSLRSLAVPPEHVSIVPVVDDGSVDKIVRNVAKGLHNSVDSVLLQP